MRDWVIPFLREIRPESISEQSYEAELAEIVFVWGRMANLFLHKFDSDGMVQLLGSVVCCMDKEDFDKLFESCPIFILARSPAFVQKIHAEGDVPVIIFLESELALMNWSQRQATVGHEIAHIVLGHCDRSFNLDDPWHEKQQEEADALCRRWGFEIDGLRKYLLERRVNDGGL